MQGYSTVGTNEPAKATAFYEALLSPEGYQTAFDHPSGGRLYREPGGTSFGVFRPFDGKPATIGNGTMVGFGLKTRAAVDAFHARALSLGGTDEGEPGIRGGEGSPAYFAYVRDPEGNKLCAYNFTG